MKLPLAQKLMLMHKLGYLVKIEDDHYEDQPVSDIYEATETDASDSDGEVEEGEIVYDSTVYTARPLSLVRIESVKAYIPIDWENAEIDADKNVSIGDELPF